MISLRNLCLVQGCPTLWSCMSGARMVCRPHWVHSPALHTRFSMQSWFSEGAVCTMQSRISQSSACRLCPEMAPSTACSLYQPWPCTGCASPSQHPAQGIHQIQPHVPCSLTMTACAAGHQCMPHAVYGSSPRIGGITAGQKTSLHRLDPACRLHLWYPSLVGLLYYYSIFTINQQISFPTSSSYLYSWLHKAHKLSLAAPSVLKLSSSAQLIVKSYNMLFRLLSYLCMEMIIKCMLWLQILVI